MTRIAKTFADQQTAQKFALTRRTTDPITPMQVFVGDGIAFVLKRSQPPGVEPRYLATDMLWYKWDQLANLPGSSAATV